MLQCGNNKKFHCESYLSLFLLLSKIWLQHLKDLIMFFLALAVHSPLSVFSWGSYLEHPYTERLPCLPSIPFLTVEEMRQAVGSHPRPSLSHQLLICCVWVRRATVTAILDHVHPAGPRPKWPFIHLHAVHICSNSQDLTAYRVYRAHGHTKTQILTQSG